MFNTILDKFSGIFSRSFLLCCWFPSFVAAIALVLVCYFPIGYAIPVTKWGAWDIPRQIVALVVFLLSITLFANLLYGFSYYLMRIFEGYWPHQLQELFLRRVAKKWRKLCDIRREAAKKKSNRYISSQARIYFGYPAEIQFFLPTQFGNIIRSAELYPRTIYGLDGVFWWPRLFSLIPELLRDNLNEQLIAMMTMIHFSCLFFLLGVFSLFHFLRHHVLPLNHMTPSGWIGWGIVIGFLLFSGFAYKGLLARAHSYGLLIRSSYDLYRHQLLSTMNVSSPLTPTEERETWSRLEHWLYNYNLKVSSEIKYEFEEKKEKQPASTEEE